jgi:hypothetical protein
MLQGPLSGPLAAAVFYFGSVWDPAVSGRAPEALPLAALRAKIQIQNIFPPGSGPESAQNPRSPEGASMTPPKPYGFIGFGAMEVTKPYGFIRFGAMQVTPPDLLRETAVRTLARDPGGPPDGPRRHWEGPRRVLGTSPGALGFFVFCFCFLFCCPRRMAGVRVERPKNPYTLCHAIVLPGRKSAFRAADLIN